MLKAEVWPEDDARAGRRLWWWKQDGATFHCTDEVLAFLEFCLRVISQGGKHPWPPNLPDLNPLDFFF